MMRHEQPLISIIIPAYNCERTIERTIDSVSNQTYSNLEIIVVNDGSTDSTSTVCEKLADADSRIKVIHCDNGGVAIARNRGLENSSGQYIAYIDSDDEMDKEMIERLFQFAQTSNLDIAVCNFDKVYETKKIVNSLNSGSFIVEGQETLKAVVSSKEIESYLWNKLFKSELIKNYRIPSEITLCEDLYLLVKMCSERNVKLGYIPQSLYEYTVIEGGLSHNPMNTMVENKSKYAYVIQYICDHCKLSKEIKDILIFRCFRILLSQLREMSRYENVNKSTMLKELRDYYYRFLNSNNTLCTKVKYSIKCLKVHLGL